MAATIGAGSGGPPPQKFRVRAPKFALAVPSFVWYIVLFIVPVGMVVVNGSFRTLLWLTMRTSLLGTLLCLVISLPVAYYLAFKVGPRAKTLVLALLMVPFFTNYLLRTLAWKIVLQPKGLISNFLQDEHWFFFGQSLRDSQIQLLDTRGAVQLAIVYNYLPLMIFPLWVAFDRVELHLREASKDLGANRIRTFLRVTLPLAMPGIIAGLVLVFVPLSGDYVTASLLASIEGNMAGAEVANQYFRSQDAAQGSAVAVSLIISILFVLGLLAAVMWFGRKLLAANRKVTVPGA